MYCLICNAVINNLFFHQCFDLICCNRNMLHQILIAVFGNPEIVFDAYAHMLFFNINPRLHGKNHSGRYRFGSRAGSCTSTPR